MLIPQNGTPNVQLTPFQTNHVVRVEVAKTIDPISQAF
jgi:hypothetical protein